MWMLKSSVNKYFVSTAWKGIADEFAETYKIKIHPLRFLAQNHLFRRKASIKKYQKLSSDH